MGLKGLGLGLKEMCSYARVGLLCFSLSMELGFLALLWGFSTLKLWNFGIGYFDFTASVSVYDLIVLVCLFFLGFRVWQLGRRCEELGGVLQQLRKLPPDLGSGFCLNGGVCGDSIFKISSWKGSQCVCSIGSKRDFPLQQKRSRNSTTGLNGLSEKFKEEEGDHEEEEEEFDEEEGDDVVKSREEIAKERKLRALAEVELEKERMAALTAADEAMAKIVLLQNEKGLIEREARQYREMAEQKQLYDQEVIEYLRWIILKLEGESGGKEQAS